MVWKLLSPRNNPLPWVRSDQMMYDVITFTESFSASLLCCNQVMISSWFYFIICYYLSQMHLYIYILLIETVDKIWRKLLEVVILNTAAFMLMHQ